MRLHVVAVFCCIFNSATSSLNNWGKRAIGTAPVSYDCGSVNIEESVFREFLKDTLQVDPDIPQPFRGLLYKEDLLYRTLQVPTWISYPISESLTSSYSNKIFIVLNQANQIVDIITELKNGHFMKCERNDKSIPESSSTDSREFSGYECGHEYFSDRVLQWSLEQALESNSHLDMQALTTPFTGSLYRPELRYWIYPLLQKKIFYQRLRWSKSTYSIVISPENKLVDVIAELINGEYLKCKRVKKTSDKTPQDQGLRVGYLCGAIFFSADQLKQTALLSEQKKWEGSKAFPQKYNGPPFNQEFWIYPLRSSGVIYVKGVHNSNHFLVTDSKFELITVVEKTDTDMVPCKEVSRSHETVPEETDHYKCRGVLFKNEHILYTVRLACRALDINARRFPAAYNGPSFDIPGPYLTWPLLPSKFFTKKPGKYRAVLNRSCQFAGVIAEAHFGDGSFYKCVRNKDGSTPGGKSNMKVTEDLKPGRTKLNYAKSSKFTH